MNFSIVVPLYNKAKSVKKTLHSILNQTYTNFEVIVIDDGSTDGSTDIVSQITDQRLCIYYQSNSGVSAARNHGIKLARYSHIVFVDADDIVAPEYLEHIQSLIEEFPRAGAYCTQYQFVDKKQSLPCKIHKMKKKPTLFCNYFETAAQGDLPVVASGACIPKYVLNDVGGFPVRQIQGEDQDLWSRIGLKYAVAVHPALDIKYQLDAENRVSINIVPEEELQYSRNLQQMLNSRQIPSHLVTHVKRYIGGHILHLAQLNLERGKLATAKKLIADKRTSRLPLRKLKWKLALWKKIFFSKSGIAVSEPKRVSIANLLNDKKMGGILSVVKSLSESSVSEHCEFDFKVVKPTSFLRKNYQSDIVMVHYACSWKTLLSNFVTKVLNPSAKFILQEHHYTHSFASKVPSLARFRWMLKLNYFLFDKVVAVSQGQAKWIRSLEIISPRKLVTIPQCRQLEDFLRVQPKNTAPGITIAAYGRLCDAKGFDTLIRAFKKVVNPNLSLKIAGDGPLETELRRLAKDDRRIQLVGRVQDVPGFLSDVDLVMVPSVSEAFGLVCLEAKAAGKAVIVSDIDGLSEQVRGRSNNRASSNCGMTIPEHNADVIASIIHRLPKMPLAEWGVNGRRQVSNAWKNYQFEWNQLFSSLI